MSRHNEALSHVVGGAPLEQQPVSATERDAVREQFRETHNDGLVTTHIHPTNNVADEIIRLRARVAELEADAKRIDGACLLACPDNSPATCEPVEECPRYFVVGENGHDIICTDNPAEVVKGLSELWREMSELAEARGVRMEAAEKRVAELERVTHSSDCAVHNEPAMPAGPCDCDANASVIPTELELPSLALEALHVALERAKKSKTGVSLPWHIAAAIHEQFAATLARVAELETDVLAQNDMLKDLGESRQAALDRVAELERVTEETADALGDAVETLEAVRGAAQHCDCTAFETAQQRLTQYNGFSPELAKARALTAARGGG